VREGAVRGVTGMRRITHVAESWGNRTGGKLSRGILLRGNERFSWYEEFQKGGD